MVKDFRKELIVGIGFIAGSMALFGIAVYFLSDSITTEVGKISAARDEIRGRAALIQGLAEQKASSPEVKKYQQAINLLLPQKDNLVNYQTWLDGLSRAHNVSINFYFNGDAIPPSGANAGYIRFVLNANGQYSSVTEFLRDVEFKSAQYTTQFDDFDMKKNADTYNVFVNGRTFFR